MNELSNNVMYSVLRNRADREHRELRRACAENDKLTKLLNEFLDGEEAENMERIQAYVKSLNDQMQTKGENGPQ
jgi:hypothetical protein